MYEPPADTHSAIWPALTIAALCLVPVLLIVVGMWLFGWRTVLIVGTSYLIGNVTWAVVLALVRQAQPNEEIH